MQGVIVALAGLYAASACFWRPFLDSIYTIYEIATAVGEFTLVVVIQIDLSGHVDVPVEFLLALSFAVIMANVGKQVRVRLARPFLPANNALLACVVRVNHAETLCVCASSCQLHKRRRSLQVQAILLDRVMVLTEPVHLLLLNIRGYRQVYYASTDFIDRYATVESI